MAYQPTNLTDEELFYAHIDDYLDDSIPQEQTGRFTKVRDQLGNDLPEKYRKARGNLQMVVGKMRLTESDMQQIVGLLGDDASRLMAEDKNIDRVGRSVLFGNVTRSLVIFGSMLVVILAAVFYMMGPRKKNGVDLLTAIRWESESMEQEEDLRMDFPTDSLLDAQAYIKSYPELGFKYEPIKPINGGWSVAGAMVIDYDELKMPVISFKKPDVGGAMFLFFVKGDINALPSSEPGNQKGLLYQAYGTDAVNMVAWQFKEKEEKVIAVLVGHVGVPEMAQYARQMTNL